MRSWGSVMTGIVYCLDQPQRCLIVVKIGMTTDLEKRLREL